MGDVRRKVVLDKKNRHRRTRFRIRSRVQGTAERPRLAVHKSLRYIYAQVIDDGSGQTLVSASSQEPTVRSDIDGGKGNRSAAKQVGAKLAQRAREQGIEAVVFDRGGYIYHGRLKALADGAREGGLRF